MKRCIERVTIARPPRRVILTANSKGDRPGGKIEQVTVNSGITYGQLIFARVMQVDVNSGPGRLGVVGSEIQERIKCRSRVRIQKCFPQSRLAGFADGQVLSFIPGITKTQLPVPRLEIIAKFSHLAAQTNIEQIIVVSELFVSRTGVVNAAKPNSSSYRKTASIGKEIWNSRIGDGERIKRDSEIGTLMPAGLKPMLVPGILNGSGRNGTAARDASKNERTYLKSANTVRYLSHRSRVKDP